MRLGMICGVWLISRSLCAQTATIEVSINADLLWDEEEIVVWAFSFPKQARPSHEPVHYELHWWQNPGDANGADSPQSRLLVTHPNDSVTVVNDSDRLLHLRRTSIVPASAITLDPGRRLKTDGRLGAKRSDSLPVWLGEHSFYVSIATDAPGGSVLTLDHDYFVTLTKDSPSKRMTVTPGEYLMSAFSTKRSILSSQQLDVLQSVNSSAQGASARRGVFKVSLSDDEAQAKLFFNLEGWRGSELLQEVLKQHGHP